MRGIIQALATGPGRSAVAVVRVSGEGSAVVLQEMILRLPSPRRASLRQIRGADGDLLDEALVIWMPGPDSFTGEDLFELHLHGGAAVIAAVVERLSELGVRHAEPGEFTRRAFEAGRLSLSQAEAIADLVDAETGAQRRQAIAHLGGQLQRRTERWREALIEVLALLESQIDFPDEEIPPESASAALEALQEIRASFAAALDDRRGEQVRAGFKIALVGAPNAGKSSLFNALIGRDAAIVTRHAGTTRDVLEAEMVLQGFKVVIADTAGVRETGDEIEAEGVLRARRAAADADLRIFVIALDADDGLGGSSRVEVVAPLELDPCPGDVAVFSKADLAGSRTRALPQWVHGASTVTSVNAPDTIASLRGILEDLVVTRLKGEEPAVLVRARHREVLGRAVAHLDRALCAELHAPELVGEDVRLAAREVERLTGRIDSEAVLDRVFSTFCIGK